MSSETSANLLRQVRNKYITYIPSCFCFAYSTAFSILSIAIMALYFFYDSLSYVHSITTF